jgi:hypothetical protein
MPEDPTSRDDAEPDPLDALDRVRSRELERDRLDDLDLGPSDVADEPDEPFGAAARRGRALPFVLVSLAVLGSVALATLLYVFWPKASPDSPSRAGAAAPPATSAAPSAAPTPAEPLPTLDESDPLARSLGATLGAHPLLQRWLERTGLVRLSVAVVTNVAEGESPRPHLAFLAPARPFRTRSGAGVRLSPDPAGYRAYDPVFDAVASIDASAAAAAYRRIEPLLDEAHRELGHAEGFRASLDRAIAAVLALPVLAEDVALVRHATLFRYEDPKLEGLTAAQKQLLRTGPRNVKIAQAKLRELQAALGSARP